MVQEFPAHIVPVLGGLAFDFGVGEGRISWEILQDLLYILVAAGVPKPGKYCPCVPEDISHHADLVALFVFIGLLDANHVDPPVTWKFTTLLVYILQVPECIAEAGGDVEVGTLSDTMGTLRPEVPQVYNRAIYLGIQPEVVSYSSIVS